MCDTLASGRDLDNVVQKTIVFRSTTIKILILLVTLFIEIGDIEAD